MPKQAGEIRFDLELQPINALLGGYPTYNPTYNYPKP